MTLCKMPRQGPWAEPSPRGWCLFVHDGCIGTCVAPCAGLEHVEQFFRLIFWKLGNTLVSTLRSEKYCESRCTEMRSDMIWWDLMSIWKHLNAIQMHCFNLFQMQEAQAARSGGRIGGSAPAARSRPPPRAPVASSSKTEGGRRRASVRSVTLRDTEYFVMICAYCICRSLWFSTGFKDLPTEVSLEILGEPRLSFRDKAFGKCWVVSRTY